MCNGSGDSLAQSAGWAAILYHRCSQSREVCIINWLDVNSRWPGRRGNGPVSLRRCTTIQKTLDSVPFTNVTIDFVVGKRGPADGASVGKP